MAIFDPKRCALVELCDHTPVWRGNIPINSNGEFAYHEMAVALDIEPGFSLVDISLIDNIEGGERDKWLVELNAYKVPVKDFPGGPNIPPQFNQPKWNPARLLGDGVHLRNGTAPGHLCWWQIEGGHDGIVLGPEKQSYNFIGLIEYMGILRQGDGLFLYFHCMNGTDRTGAVAAAYAMRYLGMDLDMAMAFAASVPDAGVMSDPYKQLVKSYSEWLAKNPPA
jgi:hypothetical protein